MPCCSSSSYSGRASRNNTEYVTLISKAIRCQQRAYPSISSQIKLFLINKKKRTANILSLIWSVFDLTSDRSDKIKFNLQGVTSGRIGLWSQFSGNDVTIFTTIVLIFSASDSNQNIEVCCEPIALSCHCPSIRKLQRSPASSILHSKRAASLWNFASGPNHRI